VSLLSAENITKAFPDQPIIRQVSFTIQSEDRIGLVGRNGIGKTTLLEILAGKCSVDSGRLTRSRGCIVDYVEQEKATYLDHTLEEFVTGARRDLLDQRAEMRQLEEHLSRQPDDQNAVARLGGLSDSFEAAGGFEFENEVKIILAGLGFESERYSQTLRSFSGGEKNRAGLARLLAGRGNLLLLDEPTNHLDIESTVWLEQYLTKLGKAFIVVSHDRAFLTSTVDQVWEMGTGSLERYTGGFEKYSVEREERRRLARHYMKHQQEEIRRIEEFVRRNMAGQKTKQAQSKLKYLNRIKRVELPPDDTRRPTIRVATSGRSFAHVLSVVDMTVGYGDMPVLDDVSFNVYRGDRVALVGRNGSGKTTLLKAIVGELEPQAGEIKMGSQVEVAYFDQDLADLRPDATVLDSLWECDPVAQAGSMRSMLARFGFVGEDVFKKTEALSGGEKTKLSLARLLYNPANFIILDEPTNHLDIDARESLEKALLDYEGSLLVVSHDRYFLSRIATRFVKVGNGCADVYDGDYRYFMEKSAPPEPTVTPQPVKDNQDYQAFKEESRRRGRLKKALETTRAQIKEAEARLRQLEEDLGGGIAADDWERLEQATQTKRQIEEEIIRLYLELEHLENQSDG
jgi:ATP-binding cassette subfamily F protein 3